MDTIYSLNALASKELCKNILLKKKPKKYQRLFLLTLNALSSLEKHAFFLILLPLKNILKSGFFGFFGISRYSGISNIRYFELISRSPASSK